MCYKEQEGHICPQGLCPTGDYATATIARSSANRLEDAAFLLN